MDLINAFEIETAHGTKGVELYQGDITALTLPVDLLVVSAFRGDYSPVPGTVIGSLQERWGLDVKELRRNCEIDLSASLSTWFTPVVLPDKDPPTDGDDTLPFRYLACLEMIGDLLPNSLDMRPLENLVSNLFSTVACALMRGHKIRSIAMPVLGTGNQELPPDRVVPLLADLSRQALRNLEKVEIIRFVERSSDKVRLIDDTLNVYLGRSGPETDPVDAYDWSYNEMVGRLSRDLGAIQSAMRQRAPELEHPVAEMRKAIDAEVTPRFYQFAFLSRRFAEALTMDVLNIREPSNLVNSINRLRDKNISPWVISYLHLIRAFGNEAVHVNSHEKSRTPPTIINDDFLALLICLQRVTNFWRIYRR